MGGPNGAQGDGNFLPLRAYLFYGVPGLLKRCFRCQFGSFKLPSEKKKYKDFHI